MKKIFTRKPDRFGWAFFVRRKKSYRNIYFLDEEDLISEIIFEIKKEHAENNPQSTN